MILIPTKIWEPLVFTSSRQGLIKGLLPKGCPCISGQAGEQTIVQWLGKAKDKLTCLAGKVIRAERRRPKGDMCEVAPAQLTLMVLSKHCITGYLKAAFLCRFPVVFPFVTISKWLRFVSPHRWRYLWEQKRKREKKYVLLRFSNCNQDLKCT